MNQKSMFITLFTHKLNMEMNQQQYTTWAIGIIVVFFNLAIWSVKQGVCWQRTSYEYTWFAWYAMQIRFYVRRASLYKYSQRVRLCFYTLVLHRSPNSFSLDIKYERLDGNNGKLLVSLLTKCHDSRLSSYSSSHSYLLVQL